MSDRNIVTELGVDNAGRPCAYAILDLLRQGRRRLHFPRGTYMIEQCLKLPSDTDITAAADARFVLMNGAAKHHDDYLLTNDDYGKGNIGIMISGGIWDGNQQGNPRPEGLLDDGYTGAMLHFQNVRGLKLTNMVLSNAEAYYSRFTHVHQFHIEDIFLDSDRIRNNNDGIHIGGHCSQGVIRKIHAWKPGVPGDDLVALNADDALMRTEVRGMTRGPIQDILIEDLDAHSCHTFVRLLSVTSPIRNVTIRHVRGGCIMGALNADGARGCCVQVFDESNPPYVDGIGLLENIDASDFLVHKASSSAMALIDIQERMRDFTVSNFRRDLAKDVAPGTPTIRFRHLKLESGELNGEPLPPLLQHETWEASLEYVQRLKTRTSCLLPESPVTL